MEILIFFQGLDTQCTSLVHIGALWCVIILSVQVLFFFLGNKIQFSQQHNKLLQNCQRKFSQSDFDFTYKISTVIAIKLKRVKLYYSLSNVFAESIHAPKISLGAIKNQPAFSAAGNTQRWERENKEGKIIKFEEGAEKRK